MIQKTDNQTGREHMASRADDEATRLQLHAEHIDVTRREVSAGTVKLSTVTREQEQTIDEWLSSEHVEIERTPIGRVIDHVPSLREEEDGTTVIPVVEEVLVVQRQLLLKEEVRVKRVRNVERHFETVTIRKQDAMVTRSPPSTMGQCNNLPTAKSKGIERGE